MNARRKNIRKKPGCLGVIGISIGVLIAASFLIGGLGIALGLGKTTPNSPNTNLEASPAVWEPPVDGTWPQDTRRGLGYGETFYLDAVYVETYAGSVLSPPSFKENTGKKVTINQKVSFTRIDTSVSGAMKIADIDPYFVTGRENLGELNPAATKASIQCEGDIPNVGDATVCTFSFSAPLDEIENSSWLIGNTRIGAWPGQMTVDM